MRWMDVPRVCSASPRAFARCSTRFPDFLVTWPVVVALTFFIAWLMISRRPMFSFKKLRISKGWKASLLALVGLVVALAVWDFWLALAGICFAYILTLPLSMVAYS